MEIRRVAVILIIAATVLSFAAAMESNQAHLDFSLVRGSVGHVPSQPGGTMNDAPFAVLSFIDNNKSRTLVASDGRGDYTAVLEPGHYCVQAFDIKTGNVIHLDSRQQECIDVVLGKDVRLDIMLAEAN